MIFTDIKTFIRKQFEAASAYYLTGEEFLSEIPIQRKYSISIMFNFFRKNDNFKFVNYMFIRYQTSFS